MIPRAAFPLAEPAGVPRTIHQVWVGGPVPGWVRDRWNLWEDHLASEPSRIGFQRWTDDEIGQLPWSAALAEHLDHPVLLSDFVRVEAVAREGGIYLDCDFVPLRSIEPLLARPRSWVSAMWNTAVTLPGGSHPRGDVANAAFGFSPWHPFLARVWDESMSRLPKKYKRVVSYAGPPVWTKIEKESPGLIDVLSPDWFYPLDWREQDQRGWTVERVRDEYPAAILWHEFEQSWTADYAGRGEWRP